MRRGSSPHTRGLHHYHRRRQLLPGIIPAHAGFTRRGTGTGWGPADHPRTRGVYHDQCCVPLRCGGSSPHTRGLRALEHQEGGHERIIPAHAGFTLRVRRVRGRREDHPRTRGVYFRRALPVSASAGSSPHTRGLRHQPAARHRHRGIIPAHAGFTATSSPTRVRRGDHPRTRGVYEKLLSGDNAALGSSPHTRGLPHD